MSNEVLDSHLLQRRPRCSKCFGHEKRLNRTPSEGNNSCSERCQRIREVTFSEEHSGLRVWKCNDIGKGKFLPYDGLYIKHQGPTLLQTAESHAFYDPPEKREVKRRLDVNKKIESLVPLFECSVLGCGWGFRSLWATRTAPWRRRAYCQQNKPVWCDKKRVGSQILIGRHCWYQKVFFRFQGLQKHFQGTLLMLRLCEQDGPWASQEAAYDFHRRLKNTWRHGFHLEKEVGTKPILPKLQYCEMPKMNVCSLEQSGWRKPKSKAFSHD